MRLHPRLNVWTLACLLVPGVVPAEDGVVYLNQVTFSNGLAAIGDSAGQPLTIAQPGSYRLTSNIEGDTAALEVIRIDADAVTLDLNGFGVRCSPAGGCGAPGILITAGSDGVAVRNGTVRGVDGHGIHAPGSEKLVVEDMRLVANQGDGLDATGSSNGRVSRCSVRANLTDGIDVGAAWRVETTTSRGNGARGIVVESGTVERSVSTGNFGVGFLVGPGSTVVHNVAEGNTGFGFDLGEEGTSESTVGGTALENSAQSNTDLGLNMDPFWGYAGNASSDNNNGNANPQLNGGIPIGDNVCGTNTSCP